MLRPMAPNADPWRTLGLSPGATQDEIRRAYRRLAKVNHPDAGGDAALPRFLAIQAAYEQLAGRAGSGGSGRDRRVARPTARRLTRASRGARIRTGRAPPDGPTGGGRRAHVRRVPERGSVRPGRGAAGRGHEARGGGGRPGGSGDAGASGHADGASADPASGAHRSRRSSRRRAANTATPGSTSYEGADQEPFEPGWSGPRGTGASSGTYWTINPKEYADPRKHGPEYQARARRAREGWILDDADGPGGGGRSRPESTAEGAARRRRRRDGAVRRSAAGPDGRCRPAGDRGTARRLGRRRTRRRRRRGRGAATTVPRRPCLRRWAADRGASTAAPRRHVGRTRRPGGRCRRPPTPRARPPVISRDRRPDPAHGVRRARGWHRGSSSRRTAPGHGPLLRRPTTPIGRLADARCSAGRRSGSLPPRHRRDDRLRPARRLVPRGLLAGDMGRPGRDPAPPPRPPGRRRAGRRTERSRR